MVGEKWRLGKVTLVFNQYDGKKIMDFNSWPPNAWVTLCFILINKAEASILVDGEEGK